MAPPRFGELATASAAAASCLAAVSLAFTANETRPLGSFSCESDFFMEACESDFFIESPLLAEASSAISDAAAANTFLSPIVVTADETLHPVGLLPLRGVDPLLESVTFCEAAAECTTAKAAVEVEAVMTKAASAARADNLEVCSGDAASDSITAAAAFVCVG